MDFSSVLVATRANTWLEGNQSSTAFTSVSSLQLARIRGLKVCIAVVVYVEP